MASVAQTDGLTLDYPTRVTRALTGTFLFILADAAFVLAMMASQLYLHALNTAGQFHPHGEAAPGIMFSLIVTVVTLASAVSYYWATTRLAAGEQRNFQIGIMLAFALVLVSLAGQVALLFSLRYPAPVHAYGSMALILTAYHAIHLLLTALLGFLLIGRITRRRIAGHEYVVEATGYWWYYVAIAAVVVWAFLAFVD